MFLRLLIFPQEIKTKHIPNAALVSTLDLERQKITHAHIREGGQGLEQAALEETQLFQPLRDV